MKKSYIIITTMLIINVFLPVTAYAHSNKDLPPLKSKAAIVIDAKTGTVIYEKNSKNEMYPASLTKIATAIYAIENGELDDTVTISSQAESTKGSSVYLEEGEKVTLKKLLQGLLINSGNDAGVAIAEFLSGNVEQFSSDINEYLQREIGVHNTNFENPHGLFKPDHVTTAEDLAKITQYAMENEIFKELFGAKELEWDGKTWDTTLYKHHKLMREIPYDGVTGGKTGFVDKSGFTLATTAKRENISLIIITLNSNLQSEAYTDTENLLDYAFENFVTSRIPEGTAYKIGEQNYAVAKDRFYTHLLNAKIDEEVKEDGTLNIINEDDDTVVASFQLDRIGEAEMSGVAQGQRASVLVNKEGKPINPFNGYLAETVLIAIAAVLGIAGIFYRKRQKRKLL